MRIRLYREGVPTFDGRRLEATTWVTDEPIPLLTIDEEDDDQTGHFGASLIGMVTAVHRSADGWVTGELDYDGPVSGLAAEADFDGIGEPEDDDGVMVIRGARLRGVTLGTRPCWDEMVIE